MKVAEMSTLQQDDEEEDGDCVMQGMIPFLLETILFSSRTNQATNHDTCRT